jgi:hypothetical protein
MLRYLPWALLCVGCASAPPPEPRVVERVVYVEAPCRAPVLVEHWGHRGKTKMTHKKHPDGERHTEWTTKRSRRCDEKPTAEARERCRRNSARR